MKSIIIISAIFLFGTLLQSQTNQPVPFEYPYEVDVYDLPLASNGIKYRVYIRKPLRDPVEGEKSSTFYFLDALRLFVPSASMSYNYEYFNYIPSAYYIGIGYTDEADGVPKEANRTRDYTPTHFAPTDNNHFLSSNPVEYEGSGGADAFLKVLKDEIIPFVESHYDVSNTDRVLIGNSKSGLVAVHTFLTQPGLFNRYIIVSPSIWWDDYFKTRAERYVMTQSTVLNKELFAKETRIYFAVGENEERFGLVTDLYVLVNALNNKNIPNLKIFLDVLEGEQHEGVFPSAFMKGIVGVYAGDINRRTSSTRIKWE